MAARHRPAIPLLVKYLAVLRHFGLKPGDVEYDHHPALGLREYDEATRTYTPPANDPDRIIMRIKADHRAKTNGPRGPHTSIDGDIHAIAKTKGERAEKFQVNKPPLTLPAAVETAERCRHCGNEPCICPPPAPRRSAFQRAR